jgi:hypothetical protein
MDAAQLIGSRKEEPSGCNQKKKEPYYFTENSFYYSWTPPLERKTPPAQLLWNLGIHFS